MIKYSGSHKVQTVGVEQVMQLAIATGQATQLWSVALIGCGTKPLIHWVQNVPEVHLSNIQLGIWAVQLYLH